MRRRHASLSAAIPVVALALLLALPPAASARKLQMSGTWAIRNGRVFIPLQFAQQLPGGTMTSMGDLSKALGVPNGPIPGGGLVMATGSAPQTVRVPRHRFRTSPWTLITANAVSILQITTMFVVDGPFESATLAPGGGPGSFTWCPNHTLGCAVTGPPNGGTRNGRVVYLAGANQFGGTMQIGLAGGGSQSVLFNAIPLQALHAPFYGGGPTLRAPAVGGGTPANPGSRFDYFPPFEVTQPTMITFTRGILYPGPKLTTMLGLSTTGTGPIFRFGTFGTSAMGMAFALRTTEFGFGHTTGTVIMQQTTGYGGDDFFTVMGSDMRTALGAGNISTVAGGISFHNRITGQTPFATFHKVWLSLAPPVPSLSPAGVSAAAALLLLAVGYARHRRIGR